MTRDVLLKELSDVYTRIMQTGDPQGSLFANDLKMQEYVSAAERYICLFKIDPRLNMYSDYELVFRKVYSVLAPFIDSYFEWDFMKANPDNVRSQHHIWQLKDILSSISKDRNCLDFLYSWFAERVLSYLVENQKRIPDIHLVTKRVY